MPDFEPSNSPDSLTESELDAQVSPSSSDTASRFSGGKLMLFTLLLLALAGLASLAMSASHWKKEVIVRDFVIDGEAIIPESELLARIAMYKGSNLQELQVNELKQRLMELPYLRDVVVSKELNGSVRVEVVERQPVALVLLGQSRMVMDRDGFLLPWKKEVAARYPDLFPVSGVSRVQIANNGLQQLDKRDVYLITTFLAALSSKDYASLLIKEFHLAGNNLSWCLASQAPTRFIVGNDGNFKEKLKKFEIFWQQVVSKKGFGFYDTVDLRFRERIFATAPAATEVQPSLPQ